MPPTIDEGITIYMRLVFAWTPNFTYLPTNLPIFRESFFSILGNRFFYFWQVVVEADKRIISFRTSLHELNHLGDDKGINERIRRPFDYCCSRWALLFPVMPLSGGRGMLLHIINSLTVSSCLCPPRYCTFDDAHTLSLSLSLGAICTPMISKNGLLTSPCILTWDGLLVERERGHFGLGNIFYHILPTIFFVCVG